MTGIIFLVTLLIAAIVGSITFLVLNRNQNKKARQRTLSVIRGTSAADVKITEKDQQEKRRAEISKKLKDSADLNEKSKSKANIKQKIMQAGLHISVRQFWIFSIIFAVLSVLLAHLSGQNLFVCALIGFAALFGVPRLFLRWKAKRRQKAFLVDFADALESMVRLLKAGMPVGEAISMASREFTGPIGEEMSRIYEAQKIGVSLADAVLESARRMPITEMQMFATGISIQAQTGSSLSEVLLNLARVIRARFRLRRKIEALSSEAKASAMIIGALPFFVGGGMYAINRDYVEVLFTTPVGNAWLIGGGIWMFIGTMVMKAMINFRI